ncbi:hypothetical protein EWW49_30330 [Pseudomonas syringae]|nr:hypothetical protein EWW49_30330 [Pseudomonas syringae]
MSDRPQALLGIAVREALRQPCNLDAEHRPDGQSWLGLPRVIHTKFLRKVASIRAYTVGLAAPPRCPEWLVADTPEFWNRCESL